MISNSLFYYIRNFYLRKLGYKSAAVLDEKVKKGHRPVICTDLHESSAGARRTKVPLPPVFTLSDKIRDTIIL